MIRCFTEHPRGLRAGGQAQALRHDPDGGVLQVPLLSARLQAAFYGRGERLSAALAGASTGEGMFFVRAMRMLATSLEDVL